LSLTEHAIRWWNELARIHRHDCQPPETLFDVVAERSDKATATTRPLYLSNGGGDDRYITVSTKDGYVTVEQLAAICGVNANTARDAVNGRHNGGRGIGHRFGSTWLIEHADVLAYLEKRWKI
jgi:hypothetical protein